MKILLPVDGSEYTRRMLAYLAAHDELVAPGHQFIAFTAVAPIPGHAARFLERGMLDEYYRSQADEVLKPIERFAAMQGWNIEARHAVGHAAQAIAEFAQAERPDLIVMGTHGHSALASMVLGSVANGVLARCKLPVLLVP